MSIINKYDHYDDKELFSIYSSDKNIEIRNELIKRNLYIAEILSKKYINKGIEYEDIYQVASLGLIFAIERYDISKGFEFSSFATPTIIGEIKKYFRDKGWSIRVPRRIQELSKRVNQVKIELQQETHKVPKISDIAERLGCTQEEVIETLDASHAYAPISLDIKYDNEGEEKDVALHELIGEDDRRFLEIEDNDFFKHMMSQLTEVERKIIIDRYFENKTQMVVANELEVSQMTVSRMEKKILAKLKKEYERQL
ncbi:RNA polymerase sigma-70 factor, sigma-B/F/G subfamily [Peptoanaerobacter stomatis]|uniref:Putative RNA polymerase sigma-B factor n=1 Tax=Peptoanaerobacter stomatis TaxID=796937 RepID=J6HGR3_9FIRM|nr:SigB/SigF/SigG family RNA polymerase sigma factor [Peptoanaerobacter stomatis]EHL17456.1 RNA polymerase sigma-70 factor, sigma-B/F/G subfamily [Peptoanaerobacter stomatis]EJU24145.1 putative RNA polymerase sigma-B factor [Peptoanaerobacter stomatis]NWO25738.1 SigB/SigF/SigG family RNA polymerase sigma factor [Peptostreptococcaceae bacterium oral taxon 081]